jgi:hypothetical protein
MIGLLEAGEVGPDEGSVAACARVNVRVEVVDNLEERSERGQNIEANVTR